MVMVDDATRYCTVALLKKKSDATAAFQAYKTRVETQTGGKIKILKTDNGTEFCNIKMDNICEEAGIYHELSAPYTSRQAGVSERFIRTLVSKAKCLMFTAGAPQSMWDYAIKMSAYIVNRLPSEANPGKASPYEMWNGAIPDLDILRVWGCNAYAILDKTRRKGKFTKSALKCAFVGIDGDSANYMLYNPATHRVFTTPDVVFDEADFSVMEKLSGLSANGLGVDSMLPFTSHLLS